MPLLAQTRTTRFKQGYEAGRPQNQRLQLQAHSRHKETKGPTLPAQGQPPPHLPSQEPGTTTGLPPQGPSTTSEAAASTGPIHHHSPTTHQRPQPRRPPPSPPQGSTATPAHLFPTTAPGPFATTSANPRLRAGPPPPPQPALLLISRAYWLVEPSVRGRSRPSP